MSHVMSSLIADGEICRPMYVKSAVDVGTISDWLSYCRRHATLIVDLDGVVFKNQSRFFDPVWESDEEPIHENVVCLLKCQNLGASLVFMTSRPEKYREKTEKALTTLGFKVHALVMGCPHSSRILVNDYASSNPFPAARAIISNAIHHCCLKS